MNTLLRISAITAIANTTLIAQKRAENYDPTLNEYVKMLSPEESMAKIQLPPGYSLEPVLTEPHITEPVDCVFDGIKSAVASLCMKTPMMMVPMTNIVPL